MLWKRVITAFVLIPALIIALFFSTPAIGVLIVSLVAMAGAWEWSALIKLPTLMHRLAFLLSLLILFVLVYFTSLIWTIFIIVILWFGVIFLLGQFSQGDSKFFANPYATWGLGLFILLSLWVGIVYLLSIEQYQLHIFFLLFSIIVFDTGAYFIGIRFGKHKLAPNISPGKSIEGVIGGAMAVFLSVAIVCWLLNFSVDKLVLYVCITTLAGLASVLGDLLESAMKRYVGVKDSGNLLPGHGGILDRIDSYTAGIPFFALMIFLLGI